ncbi:cytochrome c1 [Altererythrobacter sp. MF3-039]|uniref:cytochrome c1 n=1 Tax=Altererythrobacter sp. MF3-039 TaxID=3252901 RepID=UPI00390CC82A
MIRILASLVGLGFTAVVLFALGSGIFTVIDQGKLKETPPEYAFKKGPRDVSFAHDGPFGKFDRPQLQRGMQVYKEVCAACHGLKYVAFRDLEKIGYTEGQVKALAAEFQVPGIDPNTGEAALRPGLPTDYFPSPYPNDVAAAAANNNAIPPDLSLMTKARANGTAYVYSLLVGYQEPSAELLAAAPDAAPGPGLYHNPYFPNLNLAMAPPLTVDGQVTYAEGNPEATIEQMSKDVAAFLAWTAEPTLEKRRQTGWPVLGFLLFATILAYLSKKQIWSAVKPKKRD